MRHSTIATATPTHTKIIAQDGGEIDLSSVTHITNPHRGEDCLRFAISGGTYRSFRVGDDRSQREPVRGYTEFDIDVPLFQLPNLQSVDGGQLNVSSGMLQMPTLQTAEDVRFDLSASSSLEAAALHTATNHGLHAPQHNDRPDASGASDVHDRNPRAPSGYRR